MKIKKALMIMGVCVGAFFTLGVCAKSTPVSLGRVVAIVNDDVITSNQVDEQMQLIVKQLQSQKTPMPSKKVLQKQVLQHLIDVDLQLQMAKTAGIEVTDDQVNDALKDIAKRNKMTVSALRNAVQGQGVSWTQYHDNIKKEMLLARLQQAALGKDITITDEQVNQYLKANKDQEQANRSYRVKNILVPLPEAPSPEEIKTAKAKAKALLTRLKEGAAFSKLAIEASSSENALQGGDLGFRLLAALPEVFAKAVVKMKAGDVYGPIRTPNGFHLIKLVATKGENTKHFVNLTHVRHILLKTDAVNTSDVIKKKLQQIRQRILKGEKFGDLAKQHSKDLGNATKGGDLGWVHPGELVPNFEQNMDKLKAGQVSLPVETQFGWHLIQVVGRKKIDDSESFKKQQVRQLLYQRKFNQAVQNWLQQMRASAYIKVFDKGLA